MVVHVHYILIHDSSLPAKIAIDSYWAASLSVPEPSYWVPLAPLSWSSSMTWNPAYLRIQKQTYTHCRSRNLYAYLCINKQMKQKQHANIFLWLSAAQSSTSLVSSCGMVSVVWCAAGSNMDLQLDISYITWEPWIWWSQLSHFVGYSTIYIQPKFGIPSSIAIFGAALLSLGIYNTCRETGSFAGMICATTKIWTMSPSFRERLLT